MAEVLAAAAATAQAAPAVLTYLEHKLNAPVRRHRLACDNRKRLELTQDLLTRSLQHAELWINETVCEKTTRSHLLTWKASLQHAKDECTHLSPKVAISNQFSQVHRAKEILDRSEKVVQEFFDFAKDIEKERMKTTDARESAAEGQPQFRSSGTVPINPPRLTLDYDDPDTPEGQLKAAVLEQGTRKLLAVVASGRGGVGKSCALRGLSEDDDVKMRFSDGVQFMGLGKNAGMDELIQEIAAIVEGTGNEKRGKSIRGRRQLQKAVDEAKEWFEARKCLLLVDDVWKANGIDGGIFYVLAGMINSESRLVYTTRDISLALKADKCIQFEPRKAEDSRKMLLNHAELKLVRKEENIKALEAILDACRGIPLRLAVAGAGIRQFVFRTKGPDEDALRVYYGELNCSPELLVTQDYEAYGPVRNVVDTSISVLGSRWKQKHESGELPIRKMHQSLCVLEKQQEVPMSMLQRLWGLSDKKRTVEVMEALNDVGVVEVKIPENRVRMNSVLRVHDDILDVLVFDAGNQKQEFFEGLLNNYSPGYVDVETVSMKDSADSGSSQKGIRNTRTCLNLKRLFCWKGDESEEETEHESKAACCARECRKRKWWELEDEDKYLPNNLCRLLKEAGEVEELTWLLLQPQWIIGRLQNNGIFAVEKDISVGIGAVTEAGIKRKDETKTSLKLIAEAARLSHHAVLENPREAWFQLYGRLTVYSEKWETIRVFLERVEESAERPWAKARNGFLTAAGGAMLDSFAVDGLVRCIVSTENELRLLCERRGNLEVMTYDLKYGSRRTVDIAGEFWPVTLSRNGIAGVDDFSNVQTWGDSVETREVLGTSRTEIRCIAMSEDSRWVACGLGDYGKVLVWDVQSGGTPYEVSTMRHETVFCVAVSAAGLKGVCGLGNGSVWIWDLGNGGAIWHSPKEYVGAVSCVAFNKDGGMIAFGLQDGTIRVWNAQKGICAGVLGADVIGAFVTSVAFAEEGKAILWGSLNGAFGVGEYESGRAVKTVIRRGGWIECVGASEDGAVGFCASTDGTVRTWDVRRALSEIGTQDADELAAMIRCTKVSADGKWIATGLADGTIRLFDGESGVLLLDELSGHHGAVRCFSFSVDGQRLVSGGEEDRTVRIWDLQSRSACGDALRGHKLSVTSVVMSADGTRVASGSSDFTVRVWDAQSGQLVGDVLHGHTAEILQVAISADGTRVASGSFDRTLRVWDVQANFVTHLLPFPSAPSPVSLAVDGSTSATVRLTDGTAYLCNFGDSTMVQLPTVERPPAFSSSMIIGTPNGRLWLGTAEDNECGSCQLGFFHISEYVFAIRFCEVQQ